MALIMAGALNGVEFGMLLASDAMFADEQNWLQREKVVRYMKFGNTATLIECDGK